MMPSTVSKITRFFLEKIPAAGYFSIRQTFFFLAAFFLIIFSIVRFQAVSGTLTDTDRVFLGKMFTDAGLKDTQAFETFEKELQAIGGIQRAVFTASPAYRLIPVGHTREPEDLYKMKQGYCFDRARSIDKALRLMNFKSRYASLYSTDKTGSAIRSLITAGGGDVRSHAMVEVLTSKGWLVVDTVNPWLALDNEGNPLGLEDLQTMAESSDFSSLKHAENAYFLYKKPFTYVYGLYSRHGQFYPPYAPFPDINWQEILQNF